MVRGARLAGAFAVLAAAVISPPASALEGCSFLGLDLWGEVAVVDVNPDLTVEIVTENPDLRVQWVERHADACGEWRRVNLGADFRVRVVPAGGDVRIELVESEPGLP